MTQKTENHAADKAEALAWLEELDEALVNFAYETHPDHIVPARMRVMDAAIKGRTYTTFKTLKAALSAPRQTMVDVEGLKNECMAHFMKHRIGYTHNKSVAKTIPPLIDYLHAQGHLSPAAQTHKLIETGENINSKSESNADIKTPTLDALERAREGYPESYFPREEWSREKDDSITRWFICHHKTIRALLDAAIASRPDKGGE